MVFDVEKLREEIAADNPGTDLSGKNIPGLRVTLYEIADNDDMTEMEQYLRKRRVHRIDKIVVELWAVISSQ